MGQTLCFFGCLCTDLSNNFCIVFLLLLSTLHIQTSSPFSIVIAVLSLISFIEFRKKTMNPINELNGRNVVIVVNKLIPGLCPSSTYQTNDEPVTSTDSLHLWQRLNNELDSQSLIIE